jgi:hypothetical protein
MHIFYGGTDKAKPIVRWGRKAAGLNEIAGLPERGAWLFLCRRKEEFRRLEEVTFYRQSTHKH